MVRPIRPVSCWTRPGSGILCGREFQTVPSATEKPGGRECWDRSSVRLAGGAQCCQLVFCSLYEWQLRSVDKWCQPDEWCKQTENDLPVRAVQNARANNDGDGPAIRRTINYRSLRFYPEPHVLMTCCGLRFYFLKMLIKAATCEVAWQDAFNRQHFFHMEPSQRRGIMQCSDCLSVCLSRACP